MAYTIESSYKPFTFQELATPYMLYKDAYDKQEANLEALYDKANTFSYLDDLPEDSKARGIYDNYMKTLNDANVDFAANGLTMNNRGMYDSIRKRYQGEIGRLAEAKTKADEINKLRLSQQGQNMIYSKDNIGIDDLIGKEKPNLYGISGNFLYELGNKAGASSSSRVWSNAEVKNTVNKFFNIASQSNGYSPELLAQLRDNLNAIPGFQEAVDSAMKAQGVSQNLTGNKLEQARLNFINGFVDGCTYKRNDNIMQNPEPEFNEKVREFNTTKAMQEQQFNDQLQTKGFVRGSDNKIYYDPTQDAELQKATAIAQVKAQYGKAKGKASNNTQRGEYLSNPVQIIYDGKNNTTQELPAETVDSQDSNSPNTKKYKGNYMTYGKLERYLRKCRIWNYISKGIPAVVKANPESYDFYYTPYNEEDGTPYMLTVVPHKVQVSASANTSSTQNNSSDSSVDLI